MREGPTERNRGGGTCEITCAVFGGRSQKVRSNQVPEESLAAYMVHDVITFHNLKASGDHHHNLGQLFDLPL